jgi:hypothetical protein
MNKSNQDKKKKIFSLFSQNLEWVKEEPTISFNPDFSNGYICPLCFEVFFEEDLDISKKNYLTLEDIPPKSLGGKPLALTCKNCNSKSGHELDIHLLNRLQELDSELFLKNSKANVTIELNGNKINGIVDIDQKGKVILDLQPNRSNPIETRKLMKDLFPPVITKEVFETPKINYKLHKRSKESRADVALLRIAYLIAYSTFGNSFLINGGLFKVREQILNPDKEILPKPYWIKYDFPKEAEGINLIIQPKELRCFLVIFNLVTKSQSRQIAIVLPGPSKNGLQIYEYIKQNLCAEEGESLHFTLEHIPKIDYLKKKNYAFACNWYWQEWTKDDHIPSMPLKQ